MSKKKNPKFTMKQSDLRRAKKEVADSTIENVFIMFLTVMTSKWGFGKKRLKRIVRQMNELAETIHDGYVTFEKLRKALYEEYGIEVRFR